MSAIYVPNSIYKSNGTEMPNLVINRKQPDMVKSVIIENPHLELDILRKIAALDGDPESLTPQDISANPEAGAELLGQLQGMSLYSNDNSPGYGVNITFHDLQTAQRFLENIRKDLGDAAFNNSKVVFEELLLGLDIRSPIHSKLVFEKLLRGLDIGSPIFSEYHSLLPNPHIILYAYNIPKNGSVRVSSPKLSSLSPKTREILYDLQLYKDSNALISRVIEHPDRELQLLREIAGTDGHPENISSSDIQPFIFQNKLIKQLEGYRLYTNDPGKDATQADLNSAYALLSALAGRYDLAHSAVMLGEKILPDNERRVIQEAHIILDED